MEKRVQYTPLATEKFEMPYRTFHKKILAYSFHDRGSTMPPHFRVQDVFLPLKESRSCLIVVEIIELQAFDYRYD
jgi:hypothetical protein